MTTQTENQKIQDMDAVARWYLLNALEDANLSGITSSMTTKVREQHTSFRQQFCVGITIFGDLERCSTTVSGDIELPKEPKYVFEEVEECVHRIVMLAIKTYNWVQACEEALQRCIKGEHYGASLVEVRHTGSPVRDGSFVGTTLSISGPDYVRNLNVPIETIETYKSEEWNKAVENITKRLSGMLHDHTEACKLAGLYQPARSGPAIYEDLHTGKIGQISYPDEIAVTLSCEAETKPSLWTKIANWFKKEKKDD